MITLGRPGQTLIADKGYRRPSFEANSQLLASPSSAQPQSPSRPGPAGATSAPPPTTTDPLEPIV
jgi:hypothetical protein